VAPFETEIRIAATSCQTVPDRQMVPSALDFEDDRAGESVACFWVAAGDREADQHLVQHDVVEHLDVGRRGRSAAISLAISQQRSTMARIPSRPRLRRAA
jgi:hypothetical protein